MARKPRTAPAAAEETKPDTSVTTPAPQDPVPPSSSEAAAETKTDAAETTEAPQAPVESPPSEAAAETKTDAPETIEPWEDPVVQGVVTAMAEVAQQAAAEMANAAENAPKRAERRLATVASRMDHDGELYLPDDVVLLTEAEFTPLSKGGAVVEKSWDDCALDE